MKVKLKLLLALTLLTFSGLFGTAQTKVKKIGYQDKEYEYHDSEKSTGLRGALVSQLELNHHFSSGIKAYRASAGIYLQSQNLQRDIIRRGDERVNVGARNRDTGGNEYTAGCQLKW